MSSRVWMTLFEATRRASEVSFARRPGCRGAETEVEGAGDMAGVGRTWRRGEVEG